MIKLVVFDWNGVLIADTQACVDGNNYILKMFGGRPGNIKKFRDTYIIPLVEHYVLNGCDRENILSKPEKIGRLFHEFYEKRVSRCRSRKGAKQTLEHLKKKSIKSIILSNHMKTKIISQLKRLGLSEHISEILSNTVLHDPLNQNSTGL